jgi:phage protein U
MSTVTNGPDHRPGRVVAENAAIKVHEYFTRHWQQIRETRRETPASVASADAIEAVIDAAFRVSLRREEGYLPRLSLALLAPEDAVHPLVFEEALPLTPGSLARVSPAVARSRLQVAVWHLGDELRVWGTVRSIPLSCCVIEVVAPGLLVIKHGPSEPSRKFVNVAVLEGDQIKIVDDRASTTPDCPPLVSSVLGCDSTPGLDVVDVLRELAVSMRAHGHGGTLLVVPADSDRWRESLVHPMPYAVRRGFATLAELAHEPREHRGRQWETDLSDAVEMIAGLTAVDGATVITDQYELIAFGAKIAPRQGHRRVEQVTVTESIEDAVPGIVHPTQLGGTRHFSAVHFVNEQRNAVALVASQDGRFTVFSWSPSRTMVHGRRVEALLM